MKLSSITEMEPRWSSSSPSPAYEYTTVSSAPPKKPSGRTKFRETRHPLYRGVRWRKGRWVCELREPAGKNKKQSRIWVGTFPTAEMAARAHDVAAMALCGSSACLNYDDSARLLSVPSASAGPRAIQRAAAEAARSFPTQLEPAAAARHDGPPTPSESTASSSSSYTSSPPPPSESTASSSSSYTSSPPPPQQENQDVDEMDMTEFDLEYLGTKGYSYYATMAEWLLVEPPPLPVADTGYAWEYAEGTAVDVPLWSYK